MTEDKKDTNAAEQQHDAMLKQLEELQAKNKQLENQANEEAAKVKLAEEKAAKLQSDIEAMQKNASDVEAARKEAETVAAAQMKYFDKTWPVVVKNNATVKDGKNKLEVGFLPGIHKIRVPGFNTETLHIKDKQGNIKQTIRVSDHMGRVHLDTLIEYFPHVVQKLWDKKVNIFRDLKSNEAFFGPKQINTVAEVVEEE